jgi:hypothetical protein
MVVGNLGRMRASPVLAASCSWLHSNGGDALFIGVRAGAWWLRVSVVTSTATARPIGTSRLARRPKR